MNIEILKVPHLRHRHHEVEPRKLHHPFHHSFLVPTPHRAELVAEQVMAPQLAKPPRQLTLPAQDLRHRHPCVVVDDSPGHPAEKLKTPHMSLKERLRAFALEGHHEKRVAIRQRHDEERHLAQLPVHLHQRIPEIHLRFARRVRQRHEHLPVLLLHLPHRVLHRRVAAHVAFLPQALKNALRRVPLLRRHRLVLFEDLPDPPLVWTDLLPRPRLALPVTRRFAVLQNLLERISVHPRLPQNLSAADSLN